MRIRRLLPTLLLSTAAVLPAAAGQYDICLTAADSVNCIIEQAEFARQRNDEINASIANVARVRAFEQARNAEIAASIAAVNAVRTRQLEIQQNALATRVLAAANAERNRRFAARQNELATDSVERVAALRKWELAMSTTHCKSPRSRTPRCAAERAQKFAKRQNALAVASIERVKVERARQFAAARNAESEASIAAVARNRASILAINTTHCTGIEITPRCEAERNRELTLALTHCKTAGDTSPRCAVERDRDFVVARNVEINASIAAVALARGTSADYSRIETSAVCNTNNCRSQDGDKQKVVTLSAAEYAALTSHCVRAPQSPRCEAERLREFAAARNAEIERSLAAVARNRAATLALNTTHCKGSQATPRCAAERAQERNRARVLGQCKLAGYSSSGCNLEPVRQAVALSAAEYAALTSHCVRSPRSPRCEAERIREFAAARNAEIQRSLAAVARNRAAPGDHGRIETSGICKPYNCSMEPAEYAMLTSHCVRRPESPRCEAERIREFAAARNAEIERSLAAVARNRAARLSINTTHCNGPQLTPRCAAERNRELTLALTHCKSDTDTSPRCAAQRDRDFHTARNAEINHSIAAVAGARALQRMQAAGVQPNGRNNALNAALSAYGSIDSPLETGAIGGPDLPIEPGPTPAQDLKLQHNSANEPCRPAGQPFAPLPFTKGISVDESMVPELDRLAGIASLCPGVRIEVHGYSDGRGSPSTNRSNAQAGAQAVTDYLIAAGIAANRVAAIGRGGMHSVLPYSKNDRQRRVEFVVRDPGMDAVARRVMWDLAELLDPTYVPAVAGLSP